LIKEWYFIITAQGGPTSVTSQVPVEATSYAHRDQIFEWQLVDGVSSGLYPDAEGIAWLNPFVSEIQAAEPNTTFGMYYVGTWVLIERKLPTRPLKYLYLGSC